MVFVGNGLSYQDLMRMDLSEFFEAEAARVLWQGEWNGSEQNNRAQ